MSDKVRLSVRIPIADKKKLIAEADELGISLSKYVRRKLGIGDNK